MITQKVKRSFSKSADSYERHGTLQKEVSDFLVAKFAPAIFKKWKPARVLDVGCGTGFTATAARRRWKEAEVTALDLALPMAQKTKKSGTSRVVAADALALPFPDGYFDVIISSLAFQWAARDETLFSEMHRVLRPGGQLLFSTLRPGTLRELQEAYDKACRDCTGEPARFDELPSKEFIMEALEKAGFRDTVAVCQTRRKSYETVETLFQTLKGVGAAMPGRPDNTPRRDVLSSTVKNYSKNGLPVTATYELLYARGRREE